MDFKCCKHRVWLLVLTGASKSIFIMGNLIHVTNLAAVCPARGYGGWCFGNSETKICRNSPISFFMYCPSVPNNVKTAELIFMKCDDLRGIPKLLGI